ncbi:hypothetical protein FOQG_00270 [Fusarium oxysporum f. sp. raphani 54005]|uniref:Uncharacterized protein n=1 Tax=Fusarium oxysporum f. sp. raphani 54005 TaxID=1089458 RepID=X0D9R2_FUSOX|nr:hypothetical protein FOQG_00270 [Fusarium oxysporum f. sp. raphani 54005]
MHVGKTTPSCERNSLAIIFPMLHINDLQSSHAQTHQAPLPGMASRFESGGGERQSGGQGMSNGYSGRHDVLRALAQWPRQSNGLSGRAFENQVSMALAGHHR